MGFPGYVAGLPEGDSATFLSGLHVGSDGLIARYVAQMCVPEAFPRAGRARAATRSRCP